MAEQHNYAAGEYGNLKEWTIMVYLAGDNNLSANSIAILQDLEAAAVHPDVRVLACYDPNTPLPKGARYLELHRPHYGNQSSPPFNWGLHNDMATPGHIVVSPDLCNDNPAQVSHPIDEPIAKEGFSRFLRWALNERRYPSRRRLLILFGHGTLIAGNTFLTDKNPPSFLRLKEFADVIRRRFSHQKLDILACDNCVMNGIEAAYEIRDHVDFMIGSQDLMLAVGWPFRKIVKAVQSDPRASSKAISRKILKACARNLMDFSLMERSSEQSVIDLRKFRNGDLRYALKELSEALQYGLSYDRHTGEIEHPAIVDAIRLARLDAQSYWDETFVDLYDFCELLARRADEHVKFQVRFINEFLDRKLPKKKTSELEDGRPDDSTIRQTILGIDDGPQWLRIFDACMGVILLFKFSQPKVGEPPPWERSLVPYAYYICSDLQYSHGLSIYFPWVMPEEPIIFEPVFDPVGYQIKDYRLQTAFDEYRTYSFAGSDGADWTNFLLKFFRTTLRNVRVAQYEYDTDPAKAGDGLFKEVRIRENAAPPIDLQKTSSDTGEQDERSPVKIKNYPRRFYLSPADCLNRDDRGSGASQPSGETGSANGRVSYLGWNIRGIAAEAIDYHPPVSGLEPEVSDEAT